MSENSINTPIRPGFAASLLLPVVVAAVMPALLPGAPYWATVLALTAAWAISALVYRTCRYRTAAGWGVLIAIQSLLTAGAILNIWYFTTYSGGTWTDPVLHNYDSRGTWLDMLWMLGRPGGQAMPLHQHGYPAVALMACLGMPNILTPLVFSTICSALTVITTGVVCSRVAPEGRQRSYSTIGMALTASVGYLMASGSILLKDALMCLMSISLVLGVLDLGRRRGALPLICLVLLVQAVVRPGALPTSALLLLAACFLPDNKPSRKTLIIIAIIAMIAYIMQGYLLNLAPIPHKLIQCDPLAGIIYADDSHSAWHALQGDYTRLPWYMKLLWLPASFTVECITPFPWNFGRDVIFGPTQAWAHVAYPWYAILGVLIWFSLARIRRAPRAITVLFLWALTIGLALAYMNGGNIARHCLPLVPALIPAAVYTLQTSLRSRGFYTWFAIYAATLAGALLVAHHLQTGGI